jgi:phosphoglucomutase
VTIKDYKAQEEKNLASGETKPIDLPTSNVLQFITEDGSMVTVRPSGTEPKIKFYCSVNTDLESRSAFDMVTQQLEDKMDTMIGELTD